MKIQVIREAKRAAKEAVGHEAGKTTEKQAGSRRRSRGQSLVIVGLLLTLLMLFAGLGTDAGNLMGKSAKLQSAVDAAALSAAQALSGSSNVNQAATTKAYQILEANGIPSTTLPSRVVDFPGTNQVRVSVVQQVDTYFMRLIPMWRTVNISAQATADLNAFAEINAKPYGLPGVVNELNLMVWGPDSWRQNGDVYSPANDRDPNNGSGTVINNSEHSKQPYGYLFRIDVPSSFPGNQMVLQIFDPDSYNRTDTPPAWATPQPQPSPGTPVASTATPAPDQFARCGDANRTVATPGPNAQGTPAACTSNSGSSVSSPDPGMYLKSFPINGQSARPSMWRVDEYRCPYPSCTQQYQQSNATVSTFTLWHFDSHITSAFGDPYALSDYYPTAGGTPGPVAQYTNQYSNLTDLRWFQPSGFQVNLDQFATEANGGKYFYLYIQGTGGSSENNYDLRVGPPQTGYDCTAGALGAAYTTDCYVNQLYWDKWRNPNMADWNDGGAKIFAKRALPLNLDTGDSFPPALTQINKNAAGQVLGIRHFDMDNSSGTRLYYQMQKCGCTDLANSNCWADIPGPQGTQTWGQTSGNDAWTESWSCSPCTQPDPEKVYIPIEGSAAYNTFFVDPNTQAVCDTSWLRISSYPSFSQDTTVWELPYLRPRLIH